MPTTVNESKEYAVYRGDEFLFIGTIKECAERLEVSENTVRFYSTPAYRRRRSDYQQTYFFVDLDPTETKKGRPSKITITPQEFVEMEQAGKTYTQIARKLDVNYKTLHNWRMKNKEKIETARKVDVESKENEWF